MKKIRIMKYVLYLVFIADIIISIWLKNYSSACSWIVCLMWVWAFFDMKRQRDEIANDTVRKILEDGIKNNRNA